MKRHEGTGGNSQGLALHIPPLMTITPTDDTRAHERGSRCPNL